MEISEEKPSKSQRKRDAEKSQELGTALVKLAMTELAQFELPDELIDAIKFARTISQHGALKRQLQFIGKLMRNIDCEPIQRIYDDLQHTRHQQARILHSCEQWRDKLIHGGKNTLTEFLDQFPQADHQQLRHLLRQAMKEFQLNKSPKSTRLLFKFIHQLIDNEAE